MRSQDRYESEEEHPARPFPHEGLLGIFNDRQAPQPPVAGDRERDVPVHVQLYGLLAARSLHHDGVTAGGQLEFKMPLIPDLRGRAPVYRDGDRIGCEQCGTAADVGYLEDAHETGLHLSAFNNSLRTLMTGHPDLYARPPMAGAFRHKQPRELDRQLALAPAEGPSQPIYEDDMISARLGECHTPRLRIEPCRRIRAIREGHRKAGHIRPPMSGRRRPRQG